MKELIKNTGLISSSDFLLVGVSIIRNKFLSVNIGPEGFGAFSLLSSFFGFSYIKIYIRIPK